MCRPSVVRRPSSQNFVSSKKLSTCSEYMVRSFDLGRKERSVVTPSVKEDAARSGKRGFCAAFNEALPAQQRLQTKTLLGAASGVFAQHLTKHCQCSNDRKPPKSVSSSTAPSSRSTRGRNSTRGGTKATTLVQDHREAEEETV